MFCPTRRLQNYYYYIFLKRSWRCNFSPNKRGRRRSWPCIFPPKKTWFVSQGLSVAFHFGLNKGAYGRSVGRTDGGDVITKPKFLALMGLPKSLSYGASRLHLHRARSSARRAVLNPFLRLAPHSKTFAQMYTTITLLDQLELQKHLNACLRKVVTHTLERFLNLRCPAVSKILRFRSSFNSVCKVLSCHVIITLLLWSEVGRLL